MMSHADLLIEIGTEELPPKSLKILSEAFSSGICSGLEQRDIHYAIATPFATPRRLAVLIKGIATMQPDRDIEKRGPALTAAYDKTGNPTKAAEGFARSCGVEVSQLEKLETDKGSWLIYRSKQAGQATEGLLTEIIEQALAALPIPKRMRWADLDFEFVRPIHWVVILLGHHLVETKILGVASGRMTRGHRFHHPQPMEVTEPNDYAKLLEEKGWVIPLFSVRRERIKNLVEQAAEELNGDAVISEALLDEVTSLVEYPVPIVGAFDPKFLDVPAEALIAAMKEHQKCFHIVDKTGKLLPNFIAVSNIKSSQPDVVRTGNERVIRPRLTDAMFFWEQDKAKKLETRSETLKTVTFQNKLGSVFEKSARVATVAAAIAQSLGASESEAQRAALLSKCDLLTNMVNEFPELQGIMGEYYARHDGETENVAIALREQYMPRFWGDELPANPIGQALAIADKLDTLVGIFGIGQPPTGDKDPFGLRRAALGILRITIECQLPLNIEQLLQTAQTNFAPEIFKTAEGKTVAAANEVFDFMLERLRGYYQDKGIPYDTVDAVLACRPVSPADADVRIHGVQAFRQLPQAESLAAANKRIHNILKKVETSYPAQPSEIHFEEAAEKELFTQVQAVNQKITPFIQQGNYSAALQALATLREAVDTFFDKVMVMAENPTVRDNRLALLSQVQQLFLQIADISRLQG